MAAKKTAPAETLRRCIGSAKFGIQAHEAPVSDFPSQPSQKDGLGRMCRIHWKEYTSALRRASTPPKAAPAAVAEVDRAKTDGAEAKAAKSARSKAKTTAKPTANPATGRVAKPSRKAGETAASAEDDATVRAEEGAASTPDVETAAEQDAILVERKTRVKSWRRQEAEKALAGS